MGSMEKKTVEPVRLNGKRKIKPILYEAYVVTGA
jgi:hypothetical protein